MKKKESGVERENEPGMKTDCLGHPTLFPFLSLFFFFAGSSRLLALPTHNNSDMHTHTYIYIPHIHTHTHTRGHGHLYHSLPVSTLFSWWWWCFFFFVLFLSVRRSGKRINTQKKNDEWRGREDVKGGIELASSDTDTSTYMCIDSYIGIHTCIHWCPPPYIYSYARASGISFFLPSSSHIHNALRQHSPRQRFSPPYKKKTLTRSFSFSPITSFFFLTKCIEM